MKNIHINSELQDLSLRIETIIYLATSLIDEALPDDLESLLSEEDYQTLERLFGFSANEMEAERLEADSIAQMLIGHKKFGFIVKAATPVREYLNGDAYQWSWGYFRTEWLYAETLDDAIELAKKWAESVHNEQLAEFAEKGGATC